MPSLSDNYIFTNWTGNGQSLTSQGFICGNKHHKTINIIIYLDSLVRMLGGTESDVHFCECTGTIDLTMISISITSGLRATRGSNSPNKCNACEDSPPASYKSSPLLRPKRLQTVHRQNTARFALSNPAPANLVPTGTRRPVPRIHMDQTGYQILTR